MKTQKSFRKRALLSSVAMLLVATVAVGSATFAWFSTKTTATASQLTASTTQASSLVLSSTGNDDSWTYDLKYGMTSPTNLEPVSTVNFTNWWTNTADAYDGGTSKSTPTPVNSADHYYVVKDLYIKNNGSEAIDVNWALTVTEKETGDADFFRVALQKVTTDAPGSFVYANAKDDAPLDSTGAAASTIVTTSSKTASLGKLQPGEPYHYRIYMYYEGTDAQCKDSLAVNTCDVSFTFSKAEVVGG